MITQVDSLDDDKDLFGSDEEEEPSKHKCGKEQDEEKEGNKESEEGENINTKIDASHKEGKGIHNKTTNTEKITMMKRNPSKAVMEEVKEMIKRDKETFTLEECKGKVGGHH